MHTGAAACPRAWPPPTHHGQALQVCQPQLPQASHQPSQPVSIIHGVAAVVIRGQHAQQQLKHGVRCEPGKPQMDERASTSSCTALQTAREAAYGLERKHTVATHVRKVGCSGSTVAHSPQIRVKSRRDKVQALFRCCPARHMLQQALLTTAGLTHPTHTITATSTNTSTLMQPATA